MNVKLTCRTEKLSKVKKVVTGTNIEGENSLEGTTEGLDVVSEKEVDLLNQLSPEEVKAIMTSVMEEMVQGLQVSLMCRV